MLVNSPSGEVFALSMDAGMGWDPSRLLLNQVIILCTQGEMRAPVYGRPGFRIHREARNPNGKCWRIG